jgi:hypothetical protein
LELSVDEFFFQDKEGFAETVVNNERFKNVLEFLNFAGGYGSCKVGEFVWFIENVGSNLVDRKVGDLVAEKGVKLCDIFEHGYDFGHESTDVLVIFAIG